MLRTAGWLAFPKKALSAGFDDGISTVAAAQLLGGWTPTETGLAPASRTRLIWTHNDRSDRSGAWISVPRSFRHRSGVVPGSQGTRWRCRERSQHG